MRKIFTILLVLLGILFFPLGLIELGYFFGVMNERKRTTLQAQNILQSTEDQESQGIVEVKL
ncbi:MAG TPA: hypothetical protein ENI51_07965 [Candidatus Atribacteria bacterium]|nr:hypothetical protein [Candidatus Atribacteria bacterium]